ncbi:MutS family DNA mismatch repair protein [Leptospira perolatii]|uniref:MutS family DNA mismatch repair protein n=1 Tax=Leptospira perolatii TaxID=2023191 RepID=UPI001FAF616E|nr:MutS family DNA mismatch repair protein [Leptospira perolatii]
MEEKKLRTLSQLRILAFTGFLTWNLAFYLLKFKSELVYLPSLLFLIAFFKLLGMYQSRKDKIRRILVWDKFLVQQKARVLLNGEKYPEIKKSQYSNMSLLKEVPSWAKDLDFIGEKGIFSRIDTTVTPLGSRKFLSCFQWNESELNQSYVERQNTVKILSSQSGRLQKLIKKFQFYEASFRQRDEVESEKLPSYIPNFLNSEKKKDLETKSEFPFGLLQENPIDLWSSTFGTFANLIAMLLPIWIVFLWALVLFTLAFGKTWGSGIFLFNLGFFGLYRSGSVLQFRSLGLQVETLPDLGKLLRYIHRSKIRGISGKSYLQEWSRQDLSESWKKLSRIADRASLIQAPLFHTILNFLFLYDLWLWSSYKKWWNRWGEKTLLGFQDICELDSLLPLANLKWIEPEFAFPKIVVDAKKISAKSLVHPLIQPEKRVANDLENLSPGNLLLLTGSNMSGKTTFLRSVGICGILAMAGGPVPSSDFKTPPLSIHSSVRNEDSVEEGISFFYAEVRRLAKILRDVVSNSKAAQLVLLDEILKGTNSRERTLACKGILKQLRKYNVYGIVTTHDLELSDLPDLELKHFREEVKDGKMTFDYILRPGVVQSSNALEVLRLEGIDLEYG